MSQLSLLELLEPDFQLQLLLEFDSVGDLHSLIRASPRYYQVFLLNKKSVLAALACRQVHQEVLPIAVNLVGIAQLGLPLPRELAITTCKLGPPRRFSGSLPDYIVLCRLLRNIEFLIDDYTLTTLTLMDDVGGLLDTRFGVGNRTQPSHNDRILSRCEFGRLQRAFCRFETFRCLFTKYASELDSQTRQCRIDAPISAAEHARLYLKKFRDFEIEQINCVRTYLFHRLKGIYKELEEENQDHLLSKDLDILRLNGGPGGRAIVSIEKGRYSEQDQHTHIEYLMSLGLGYIRTIFQATGDQRRKLFLRDCPDLHHHHHETCFISKALEYLEAGTDAINPAYGYAVRLERTGIPFKHEVSTVVELRLPDVWQWAWRIPPMMFVMPEGLNHWGYVFWDHERLHQSGILDHDVRKVQKIFSRAP